jgi:lipopolysaccharide/colanic/teichoic acid biosynthesis glycosyltransferase
LDFVGAAIALIFVLPILLVSMAAIWITMGRPILFRQTRVTRNGREFGILKLRTMGGAAGDEGVELPPDTAPGGVEGKIDRTTRLGRFLRASSIDELPQLLNVLNGDMSLVGPRPERPEFVRQFSSSVEGYTLRHRMRAGITGWSQVNRLRGQTSIKARVEWDNHYVDNFSLWFDLKIMLLTVSTLLSRRSP